MMSEREARRFLQRLMGETDRGNVEVTEGLFYLHIVIKDG